MNFLRIRLLPISICVVLLINFLSPAVAAESGVPKASDRCPVCGMFVAPYANWISVVTFADGQEVFFDGPKDLFRYVFDLQTYQPDRTFADIRQVRVTEYYSTRLMDAQEVFFVTGSDVLGPMGAELVPVSGKANAEAFLKDHAGKAVMQFDGKDLNKVVSGD
jgi:nitrous oxide reductase accessory protein NosL